jgi:hypothetical protein
MRDGVFGIFGTPAGLHLDTAAEQERAFLMPERQVSFLTTRLDGPDFGELSHAHAFLSSVNRDT